MNGTNTVIVSLNVSVSLQRVAVCFWSWVFKVRQRSQIGPSSDKFRIMSWCLGLLEIHIRHILPFSLLGVIITAPQNWWQVVEVWSHCQHSVLKMGPWSLLKYVTCFAFIGFPTVMHWTAGDGAAWPIGLTMRTCLSEFSADGISQDIILKTPFRRHSVLSNVIFFMLIPRKYVRSLVCSIWKENQYFHTSKANTPALSYIPSPQKCIHDSVPMVSFIVVT